MLYEHCSKMEDEYLKFMSSLTSEIIIQQVYTDTGIEALLHSYVAKHKYTLREVWLTVCVCV